GVLQRTLSGHSGPILSAVFSPDGNRLATAGADKAVKVWDITAGQAVRTLPSHGAAVNQVTFSLDGARLASASSDGTVQIHELESLPDLLARGLAHATTSLTPAQCQQYLRGRPCRTLLSANG
ncbi:MAG: WD40 repeat domain-containing protein, partial [Anaerolineae bacterium]